MWRGLVLEGLAKSRYIPYMGTIKLPKDLEDLVAAEIAGGYAPNAQTVVDTALRNYLQKLAELRRSVGEAKADFEENGGISLSDLRAEFEGRWKRNAG